MRLEYRDRRTAGRSHQGGEPRTWKAEHFLAADRASRQSHSQIGYYRFVYALISRIADACTGDTVAETYGANCSPVTRKITLRPDNEVLFRRIVRKPIAALRYSLLGRIWSTDHNGAICRSGDRGHGLVKAWSRPATAIICGRDRFGTRTALGPGGHRGPNRCSALTTLYSPSGQDQDIGISVHRP